jgi:hypothetical protein
LIKLKRTIYTRILETTKYDTTSITEETIKVQFITILKTVDYIFQNHTIYFLISIIKSHVHFLLILNFQKLSTDN